MNKKTLPERLRDPDQYVDACDEAADSIELLDAQVKAYRWAWRQVSAAYSDETIEDIEAKLGRKLRAIERKHGKESA